MVKKFKFSKIAISSTSKDKRVGLIASQVYEILQSKECKIFHDETLNKLSKSLNSEYRNKKYILNNCELIIAIGGDGTILNCSRRYGSQGLPILGINLGKLGFLSDIAPKDLTNDLLEVIKGNFIKDSRFFLSTKINNKTEFLALNEVVIHSGAIAQMIEFDLFINGDFVYRQKADGIIINTPTGSTAYSLSGGGPIVHPTLDAITILPMFPQSLSTSPLIVDSSSTICIELISKKTKAMLSFDSHDNLSFKEGESIKITKSDSSLILIHPKGHNFYQSCRDKLGWSSNIIKTNK